MNRGGDRGKRGRMNRKKEKESRNKRRIGRQIDEQKNAGGRDLGQLTRRSKEVYTLRKKE